MGRRYAVRHGLPLVTSFHTDFPKYARHYGTPWLEPLVWRWLQRFHRPARLIHTPGEAVCAVIQPQPGQTLDAGEIKSYLRGRIAGYKVPKRIDFAAELPREDSGKIFKRKLREPYWEGLDRRI